MAMDTLQDPSNDCNQPVGLKNTFDPTSHADVHGETA